MNSKKDLNEKYLSFLETRTRAEKIGCGVRPMRASSADIEVESNLKAIRSCDVEPWYSDVKSGQSPPGYRNWPGCEIRICLENPDVKSGEIRAITSGISEFIRMRNPDLSGKSGCEIRAITSGISKFVRM